MTNTSRSTRRRFLGAAAMLSALPALEGDAAGESRTDGSAGSELARTAGELVTTAERAAHEGDEETLDEAEQLYTELGKRLGEIRVDICGELQTSGMEFFVYDLVEFEPAGARFDSDGAWAHYEAEDLDTAVVEPIISMDSMDLNFGQENDDVDWGFSIEMTPKKCRELALLLYRMAADAENSLEVEVE